MYPPFPNRYKFRKHFISMRQLTLGAIGFVSILVTSCSEPKRAQCEKLINVANQVVTDVQSVAQAVSTTSGNNTDQGIAVIRRVVEVADQAKSQMETLNLGDSRLREFQSRYADMYTEISRTTREMLAAAESKDREAGEQAYEAFKAATSQEAPLVNDINTYCTQ